MQLSVIQFEPKLENKEYNLNIIEKFILKNDADILVFPELSTTGYYYTDRGILLENADEFDSNTIQKFQKLSTKLNKIIILGFAERFEDRIYNSSALFLPNSTKSKVYRKTHLFYKENLVFEEGDTGFFVVEHNGINIGMMICYDWRFPEAARTLALQNADLIVCPSNLVTGVWQNVVSARALENKVYIAVANRIGTETVEEDTLTFNGESAIYSYDGSYLSKASNNKEEVVSAILSPKMTRDKSFNPYNDIFKDRRDKYYK